MAEKEYIERDALVKFITDGLNNPDKEKAFGYDAVEILSEVHLVPAADVVEVVRCKDCKHYRREQSINRHECEVFGGAYETVGYPTEPGDFCSYGERKGVATDTDVGRNE